MRQFPTRPLYVNPKCITCGMPMRLTALATNPHDPARPPIARFDCQCGEAVTRRWYPVAPDGKRRAGQDANVRSRMRLAGGSLAKPFA